MVAVIVSNKMATLHELQTIYGSEDAHDLLEIIAVNNYNRTLLNKG